MPDLNQTIGDTVFKYSDLFVTACFLFAASQIYCGVRFKWISLLGPVVDEKTQPGSFVIALLIWMAACLVSGIVLLGIIFVRMVDLAS